MRREILRRSGNLQHRLSSLLRRRRRASLPDPDASLAKPAYRVELSKSLQLETAVLRPQTVSRMPWLSRGP